MAWNQPGNKGPHNPWGTPNDNKGGKNNTPPELEAFLKKLSELFGGKAGQAPSNKFDILKWALIGSVLIWAAFGFYRVEQAEQAVVFRFGKFYNSESAGLHWNPPLIDNIQKVNVERVEQTALNATMITEDTNIVDISLSVQYRIIDAKKYLMQVSDPESSLGHATESALRHVVGSAKMTHILNEGRATLGRDVMPRLQAYLDRYNTGLQIAGVNILEALPPKEVKAAFDDVIRAKEDKERLKNQAETYANGIVPEARGQAARQLAEANGYKQEVVDRARGDASRFEQLVTEYHKAPAVTRSRLYYETMESVLSKTNKIVVEGGNNQMLYLPLDKMMPSAAVATPPATPASPAPTLARPQETRP